jgi:FKBP-type peptidyl-prolyl cis-trans isomerase
MKKYALPLALIGAVTLQACERPQPSSGGEKAASESAGPESTATNSAAANSAAANSAAANEVSLESSEHRLSYGIAYGLGKRMVADGVPLQSDAFSAGLQDALSGAEPRLTQEEISAEMQAYQKESAAKRQAAQAELAEANEAASKAYLAENAAREGVTVTDSGLQYEVLVAGDGARPGPDDTVEVHYRGTLVDGTEFDSSYRRGETVSFGVGQVIPGWTEALQLMPVGSKWKLAIPPELGYGAGGAGQAIGPNAALIFEVELVSIPSQKAAEAESTDAESTEAESTEAESTEAESTEAEEEKGAES